MISFPNRSRVFKDFCGLVSTVNLIFHNNCLNFQTVNHAHSLVVYLLGHSQSYSKSQVYVVLLDLFLVNQGKCRRNLLTKCQPLWSHQGCLCNQLKNLSSLKQYPCKLEQFIKIFTLFVIKILVHYLCKSLYACCNIHFKMLIFIYKTITQYHFDLVQLLSVQMIC